MTEDPRDNVAGTIYFLHFSQALGDLSRPNASAQHYLGWTNGESIEHRMARHRSGDGAKLLRALVAAGGDFTLVWTRAGTRNEERRLKNSGHFRDRLCTVCMGGRGVNPSETG